MLKQISFFKCTAFLFFLFINTLFVWKYGVRIDSIPVAVLIFAYFIVATGAYFINYKKIRYSKLLYFAVCVAITLLIGFITAKIDRYALNADRWSAMESAIRAWLNGDYPYTAPTHYGGRSSNFPGLMLIGLPFYLLGDIGYLQSFSFVLLAFCLYKTIEISQALKYIILLAISPAFWWNIAAISDLMSNMILVLVFIVLLEKYCKGAKYKYPIISGIILSVLILTRGIVFVPFALYFVKDFFTLKTSIKIKVILSFCVTFCLLVFSVLVNCPDLETLKLYNPIILQTWQMPVYVSFVFLSLSVLLSFKIKTFYYGFFGYAIILVSLPVFYSFIYRIIQNGFANSVINNAMDISYFSMILPFLLYPLSCSYKKQSSLFWYWFSGLAIRYRCKRNLYSQSLPIYFASIKN